MGTSENFVNPEPGDKQPQHQGDNTSNLVGINYKDLELQPGTKHGDLHQGANNGSESNYLNENFALDGVNDHFLLVGTDNGASKQADFVDERGYNGKVGVDDQTGNKIEAIATANGVEVTNKLADSGKPVGFTHTDVVPSSLVMRPDGSVVMDRQPDGQILAGSKVAVNTDGTEDSRLVIGQTAGGQDQIVAISRSQSGPQGDINAYNVSGDPNAPSYSLEQRPDGEPGGWKNLPGVTGNPPENVQVNSDGRISYKLDGLPEADKVPANGDGGPFNVTYSPTGVTEFTDVNGKPVRYQTANGETLDYHNDPHGDGKGKWYWSTANGDQIPQPNGDPKFDGTQVTYGGDGNSVHTLGQTAADKVPPGLLIGSAGADMPPALQQPAGPDMPPALQQPAGPDMPPALQQPAGPDMPPALQQPAGPDMPPALQQPAGPDMPPALQQPAGPDMPPALQQPAGPDMPPALQQPAGPDMPPALQQPAGPDMPPALQQPAGPDMPPALQQPVGPDMPPALQQPAGPDMPPALQQPAGPDMPPALQQPAGPDMPPALQQPAGPDMPPALQQPAGPDMPPSLQQSRGPDMPPAETLLPQFGEGPVKYPPVGPIVGEPVPPDLLTGPAGSDMPPTLQQPAGAVPPIGVQQDIQLDREILQLDREVLQLDKEILHLDKELSHLD